MHPLLDLLASLTLLLLVALVLVLAWRLRKTRRGERAADLAGEHLCGELEELKGFAATQARLVIHLEHCNYSLACQLYGQEQVDRQIAEAIARGKN